MAVTTHALSGDVADLVDADLSAGRVTVRVETNLPLDANGNKEAIVVTASGGKQIRLGDAAKKADVDGTFSFPGLIASDSADTNFVSGTLQYQVHVDYPRASDGRRDTWSSGLFSLTANTDVADVVAEQAIPFSFQSAFIEQAQALFDQQIDLSQIATSDDAVSALIKGTAGVGPKTRSELSTSYGARLEAATYTYNADGSVATETVGGFTTTYAYNADGTVHTATRNGVTMTYTYDASGNVTAVA